MPSELATCLTVLAPVTTGGRLTRWGRRDQRGPLGSQGCSRHSEAWSQSLGRGQTWSHGCGCSSVGAQHNNKAGSVFNVSRCKGEGRVQDAGGSPRTAHAHASTHHLQVRHGDVKVLGEVSVPHEAHVGDKEGAQVALVRGEVPHAHNLRNGSRGHMHTHTHTQRIEERMRESEGEGTTNDRMQKCIPCCRLARWGGG